MGLPQRPRVISTRRPWQTIESDRSLATIAAFHARDRADMEYDTDFFVYTLNVASMAPGVSAFDNFQVEDKGYFDWMFTVGTALQSGATLYRGWDTSPLVTMQLIDTGTGRNVFSAPTPLGNIVGTSFFPHVVSIPRRLVPKSKISAVFNNLDSAITMSGTVSLIGKKTFLPGTNSPHDRYKSQWRGSDQTLYAEDYYGYTFYFPTIAAGATIAQSQVTEADADFEWIMGSLTSFPRGATTGNAIITPPQLLNIQVTDVGPARDMFDQAVPYANIIGSGRSPGILANSHIFESRSRIQVTLTNTDAVAYNSVFVTMEGRKIFELR